MSFVFIHPPRTGGTSIKKAEMTILDCSGCWRCCEGCKYLTAEKLCAIYEDRPQLCRTYDCRETGLPGAKYGPGRQLPVVR